MWEKRRTDAAIPSKGISEILFFISLLTFGGFEAILEVPFEDTNRYKECSTGIYYDFQTRIDRERIKMLCAWSKRDSGRKH